jgi:hypothetical protein
VGDFDIAIAGKVRDINEKGGLIQADMPRGMDKHPHSTDATKGG